MMTNKAELIAQTVPVTVDQMAQRREDRRTMQLNMLSNAHMPLISFTMNIAGPIKLNPLIAFAFDIGSIYINNSLHSAGLRTERFESFWGVTGPEAFWSVDCYDASELKRLMQDIEDSSAAGRLFDIDVITPETNQKLSRSRPRSCLICEAPARICARSRAHTAQELILKTNSILAEFIAGLVAALGTEALVREVHVTPKPGLVDENNSGANSDMSLETFEASANAVAPFFRDMCIISINGLDQYLSNPSELMRSLAHIGMEAEKAMFAATNGVNTHRGAIYAIGLLISAACLTIARCGDVDIETVCNAASRLAKNQPVSERYYNTNGRRMCELYGVKGARGQAASGFRTAVDAYCVYIKTRDKSPKLAWPAALLHIMSELDDTNVLKRAGSKGYEYVRNESARLLADGVNVDALLRMDARLISMNISCGGAADMLAAAIFFNMIENELGYIPALI